MSSSVLLTAVFARAASFDSFIDAIARTWLFGDARASHITRSTSTRSSARRTAASYGVGRRRVQGRRGQPIDDVLEPGQPRVRRRAAPPCAPRDRAAARSRSSRRRPPSPGSADRTCRRSSAGTARGACPSPADAAGSDRAPVSAPSARPAAASRPARRAPCADRRPTRLWSACGCRRACRRCSPAPPPSTPPTSTA